MKVIEFFKRPRNLYLSIVVMIIVVFGLSSVTFSYYIEDSSDGSQIMKVKTIDTVILTDDLESDTILLFPNEVKEISIEVISNNDYPNDFKLYYEGENIKITSDKEVKTTINAQETLSYKLTITNLSDEDNSTKLGIKNGYIGSNIEVQGIEIK